jgi:hypothetical protein
MLGLFFDAEDGGHVFLRNTGFTFNGLRDVIPQKTELFVASVVRISNPI